MLDKSFLMPHFDADQSANFSFTQPIKSIYDNTTLAISQTQAISQTLMYLVVLCPVNMPF